MKSRLILLFMLLSLLGNTQEVTIYRISSDTYTFRHQKEMDQLRVDRYKNRMAVDCPELDTIEFKGQECTLKLKGVLSSNDIDRAIIYCISKFGYLSYKIEEK